MTDITDRLRRWAHAVDAVPASDLLDEAAAEIDRLRGYRDEAESQAAIASLAVERLRERPCPYVTGTVTRYCTLTALTLTDAEREAISTAMNAYGENNDDAECAQIEQTLWKLLERTK